jgi:hypothetical protein
MTRIRNSAAASAAFAAFLISGIDAKAAEWVCAGQDRYGCDMGTGCKAAAPSGVQVKFDFEAKTYQRCDTAGCDEYVPVISTSGQFLNLELPGRATFAKVGPNGSFTEVVSLGTVVMITYGYCRQP